MFPDPNFMPKTVSVLTRRAPVVIHGYHPSPRTAAHRRLHLLCSVRALHIYLQRVSETRPSDKLLLTYWEVVRLAATWPGDTSVLRHYFQHHRVQSVVDAVLAQAESGRLESSMENPSEDDSMNE